jgi:uncharacterized membrane-anchored protein
MTSKDWRPTAFVETTPGVITEAQADASRLEQRRSLLELQRHLMTLDSAALLLTATLIEKVFAQPLQRAAIGVAVIAFLLSLAAGGISCLVLVADAPRVGAPRMSSSDKRDWLVAGSLTLLGFIVGIAALAWFFLVNWFR